MSAFDPLRTLAELDRCSAMNKTFASVLAAMLALMTAIAALDPIAWYPHLAVAQSPVLGAHVSTLVACL